MRKLLEVFTPRQLSMIEYAFEGYDVTAAIFFKYEVQKKLCKFYQKYNHKDRLIAICENIIKNKGTFKI